MGRNDASDHVTFGALCKVGQGCMLVEGAQVAPEEGSIFGLRLTREEGLVHPRVDEFLRVIDAVLMDDPTVGRVYYRSPTSQADPLRNIRAPGPGRVLGDAEHRYANSSSHAATFSLISCFDTHGDNDYDVL